MHDLLSDSLDLFNRCHSIQALHALTSAFSYTLFTTFSLIHAYAGKINSKNLRVAWTNAMFDGFLLILVLQIILMAAVVNDKVCKVFIIVCCFKLLRSSADKRRR